MANLAPCRAWTRRLYETLAPHFPPLGNVLCIDSKRVLELDRGSEVVSGWCERNLHELWPGRTVSRFLTEVLVSLELAYRIHRRSFATYGPRLHSMRLVNYHHDLMAPIPDSPGRPPSIIRHFIDFYVGRSEDALKRVIFASQ
jgi:hypothetical protein